jgi:hypothetical protein
MLSFSHEGFSYRAMAEEVGRCIPLHRDHRDMALVGMLQIDHLRGNSSQGGRLSCLTVHFIRVLRLDSRPHLWGHLCQLGLTWPPLKINLYVTFGLALQAGVAHGSKPPVRLAIIFKPAIFHRLMTALAYVVEHDPGFFVTCHGKTHTIGTTIGGHMTTSTGITDIAELAQFKV